MSIDMKASNRMGPFQHHARRIELMSDFIMEDTKKHREA